MLGRAVTVEDGQLDPAEVEGVAGCPNNRADPGGAIVQLSQRPQHTGGIAKSGASSWFDWQRDPALLDIGVCPMQKSVVGGVAVGEAGRQIVGKIQGPRGRRAKATKKRNALLGVCTQIDGMAAIGARDQGQGSIWSTLGDGRPIEAHLAQPPDQVVPTVTARHAFVTTDAKQHLPTSAMELLGNLGAGGTRAHNQYRTGRKLIGRLVGTCVDLKEVLVS